MRLSIRALSVVACLLLVSAMVVTPPAALAASPGSPGQTVVSVPAASDPGAPSGMQSPSDAERNQLNPIAHLPAAQQAAVFEDHTPKLGFAADWEKSDFSGRAPAAARSAAPAVAPTAAPSAQASKPAMTPAAATPPAGATSPAGATPPGGTTSTSPAAAVMNTTFSPDATLTLSGHVTDPSGYPVSDVSVSVTGTAPGSTVTDGAGAWTLSLPSGDYIVGFSPPAESLYLGGYYSAAGLVGSESQASSVHLDADRTLDVALLNRPSYRGRVTNAQGTPLAAITVNLWEGGFVTWTTSTGPDGTYAFSMASGSTVAIGFTDPSGLFQAGFYGPQGYVPSLDQAAQVPIYRVDVTGLDVVLPAYPHVTGRVTSGGLGVGGIRVTAYQDGDPAWQLRNVVTESDGSYTLILTDPTRVALLITDESGTYGGGYYTPQGLVPDPAKATLFDVTSAGTTVNVSILKFTAWTGKVTAPGGAAVAGATVEAYSMTGTLQSSTSTAGDGSYSLKILPGSYVLAVRNSSTYPTVWLAGSGFAYVSGGAQPVTVGTSGLVTNIQLPVFRNIRGKLTTSTGAALSNVEVDVFRNGWAYRTTHTASDGTYSVPVEPGAYTLGFYGSPKGYADGWYSSSGFTTDYTTARIVTTTSTADATGVNAALPLQRTISGKATNSAGTALPYVFVEAFVNGSFYASVGSSSNGTYSLQVAPGAVTIWFMDLTAVNAPGWYRSGGVTADAAAATKITVSSSNVGAVNVKLPKAAQIVATSTQMQTDTSVTAYAYGNGVSFSLSDGSGNMIVPVIPGSYTLWIDPGKIESFPPGWYAKTTGFTADIGQASAVAATSGIVGVTFSPPSATLVTGKITDVHGIGLERENRKDTAEIVAYVNGHFYVQQDVPAGGSYTLILPPGRYAIGAFDRYDSYADGWYTSSGPATYLVDATLVNATEGANVGGIDIALPLLGAPGAPRSVAGRGYDSSVLVTWTPPKMLNGASVNLYTVTAAPGGRTCTSPGMLFCTVTGLTNGTSYTFTVRARNMFGTGPGSAASAAATPAHQTGATYVAVTPNRLVDSRAGTRLGLSASLSANKPATFQVTGRAPSEASKNIPSNAVAVTGNLTVVGQTKKGYFSLTPAVPVGTPSTSSLNFPTVDIRANAVTVPLGSGGKLTVTYVATAPATADVVFDVTGYFVSSTTGARYVAVTPNRLVDSRSTSRLGLSASLKRNQPATFQVTGRAPTDASKNIPSNAIAVTGNLTVANQTAKGYFSLTPTVPVGTPGTSTLNFPTGDIRANAVTVPLGSGGKLTVTYVTSTAGATADIVFDVTGYFVAGSTGATYFTVQPNRLVDSRSSSRLGLSASLKRNQPATFGVASRSGLAAEYVPVTAVAITGNLTVVNQTAKGYFSLTPTVPVGTPGTSTLNFPTADIRANAVTTPLGSGGTLTLTYVTSTSGATADAVFDVTGYFAK